MAGTSLMTDEKGRNRSFLRLPQQREAPAPSDYGEAAPGGEPDGTGRSDRKLRVQGMVGHLLANEV